MSTRTRILEYFEEHPCASAEDLFQPLSKTRANIQYHLKQLEIAGLISVVFPKIDNPHRGRPRRYYSLTVAERPNNLAQLAHALLKTNQSGSPLQTEFFRSIATQILQLPKTPASGITRLNRLVKELSSRGYQARWEAHSSGPEILFRNCPYSAILPDHAELCQIDKIMLEENLGSPFNQVSRINLPSIPACQFLKNP